MNLSMCGIDCDACKFKLEQKCEGCFIVAPNGNCIWKTDDKNGRCELFDCATEKNVPNCGQCTSFPCAKLEEWAAHENPERINNLRNLTKQTGGTKQMKHDLAFVANYYKSTIIPNTPEGFVVAEPFRHGLTNNELLKGLAAFREYMRTLYDVLAANKNKIDVKTGNKYDVHGEWNKNGDIKKCFPMLYSLGMTLIHLGLQGTLETGSVKCLTVHGKDLLESLSPKCERYYSFIKMNPERKAEAFRLLNEAGLDFEGLDISKGFDFTQIDKFHVAHKNDLVVLGLKLYAQAQANIKSNYFGLSGAFMRCDFYPLANAVPKQQIMNIHEVANAQPAEVREWIRSLDAFLLENGCKLDDGCGEFTYIKRNQKGKLREKMVCRIYMDIRGCFVTLGFNHLENHENIDKNIKCQLSKSQIDLYDANNRDFVRQWINGN